MRPDKLKTTQVENKQINETDYVLYNFFLRLKTEGPGVWSELSTSLLNTLNIKPDYVKADTSSFLETRKHLDTEPGILIANHPSAIDLFLVLSQMKRKDLLVMLQRKRFPFFETVLGKDNIVCAPKGKEEMDNIIKRVKQHIDSGGLFIIFPSGGAEIATGELGFKSGFRLLLSEVDPGAMIYSFYIDPEMGDKIQKDLIGPPVNADDKPLLLAPELHIRPSSEPLIVKIDESYSTAAEWQEVAAKSQMFTKQEQNDALLKIFSDKFNLIERP
jgi:1-acyl-sn-glycerol-3-phosphate acyltransferase